MWKFFRLVSMKSLRIWVWGFDKNTITAFLCNRIKSSMTNSTSIRDNVITTTTPEHSYPNDNMVKYLFEKFKQWPQREILV